MPSPGQRKGKVNPGEFLGSGGKEIHRELWRQVKRTLARVITGQI